MKIRQIDFDPVAFEKLKTAIGGYEDFYQVEITQGRAELWELEGGESYAITRIEYDEKLKGPILVLCCYQGKRIRDFARQMIATAEHLGMKGLRAHAKRPGMFKIGQALGFQEIERVFFYGIEK